MVGSSPGRAILVSLNIRAHPRPSAPIRGASNCMVTAQARGWKRRWTSCRRSLARWV
ncbi:MAG: hypothetical protein H7A47_05980 [Verrucomicrobiales bacterium]|nr:hypothetical protein [Verrucomicrobiales bacterium]